MRRLGPWLLLGALFGGTGTGAFLGVDMAPGPTPPGARLLTSFLATTRMQGSARFSFTTTTESPNLLLRSVTSGSGIIDFVSGATETTTVERSTGLGSNDGGPEHEVSEVTTSETIELRQASYIRFSVGNEPSGFVPWVKLPAQPGGGPSGPRQLIDEQTPFGLLPSASGFGVHPLGSTTIGGVATNGYAFTPLYRRTTGCAATKPTEPSLSIGPLEVWVGRAGRILEARMSSTETVPRRSLPAAFGDRYAGSSTTTDVLRLGHFGLPVHLQPPAVERHPFASSTGGSFAVLRGGGCATTMASGWVAVSGR